MMKTPQRPLDERRLHDAVGAANLPTLTMVLFHLTGDGRWLEDPYRPERGAGLGPNDSGGLDESVAEEVRSAAVEAIVEWSRGAEPVVANPGPSLLSRMLATAVGESVPDEYEKLMREEMGFEPEPAPEPIPAERIAERNFSVVIIGAGISGLIAGVRLKSAGVPFVILERNSEVGGVWHTNT